MWFHLPSLTDLCDRPAFARGLQVYRGQQVLSMEVQPLQGGRCHGPMKSDNGIGLQKSKRKRLHDDARSCKNKKTLRASFQAASGQDDSKPRPGPVTGVQRHGPCDWVKLTGQTQKRDEVIDRFISGQVPLFLISLKAGGVGLNLPQADTVIHFDTWWNPAAENQATDRAHRIGQTQSVWVVKLVAQGTIEERILALQARKAELANEIYSGAAGRKQPLFTEDDVRELLSPMV